MKIQVKYFAILREGAGKSQETLETTARTAGELYAQLRDQYGFSLTVENMRVAANARFESPEYALREGDELVFIPPVAGG